MALDQRNGLTPVSALLVEGAGALAIAVALAAGLRLAGRDEPGEIVASLLGAMMLAVLIFNPPPRSVPLFPISAGWAASTALWSCLALLATPVVVITSRDPYRR